MSSASQTNPAPEGTTAHRPRKWRLSNLLVRMFTGMIAIPILLWVSWFAGWWLTVAIGVLMLFGIVEFYFMERHRGLQNNVLIGIAAALAVLLSFHQGEALLWQIAVVLTILVTFALEFGRGGSFRSSVWRIVTTVGGIFYVAFPMAFIVAIRQTEPAGLYWFFAIIYCTWGTDTFAYLIGKMFGKTPFVPRLSPNKTLEGAIGGLTAGTLLTILMLMRGDLLTIPAVLLAIIAPFAATGGDLFESGVKRFFDVKDSHVPGFNLIPGHGGVLDRIDSLIWVSTLFYAYLLITGLLPPLI